MLTLSEAAKYLRTTPAKVEELASAGKLPGRQIGGEWRFLQAALADWLREAKPKFSNKDTLLKWAGVFADDETLLPMLKDIYKERGRPEVAEEA